MNNWKENLETASIRISNSCQLRCKYCYFFDKCGKLENKTFPIKDIPLIFDMFPNIKNFEFWGAETLLKIDEIIEAILLIDNLIKDERVINYVISSNFAYSEEQIIKIFNKFVSLDGKLKNHITFYLQASIDFPDYNHNKFRVNEKNEASFDLCYSAYKSFIKMFEMYQFKNICFGVGTKSTYDVMSITEDNAEQIVKDTMKYMDNDINNVMYLKDKCGIDISLNYLPTFFNFKEANNKTKRGILKFYNVIFEETFKRVVNSKIPISFMWYYLGRDIERFINNYIKLIHNPDFNDEDSIFLSCYFSNIASVDYNGNILPCHRAFTGNNFEDYVFGNVYDKTLNEKLISEINKKTKYFSNLYKQFKEQILKHPDFDNALAFCYFSLLSSCVCFADSIHENGKIEEDNIKNYMNVYPIELILFIKEYIDEFKDFFIVNYVEQ